MIDFSNRKPDKILNDMLARISNEFDKRPGSFIYTILAAVSNVLYACFFVMDMIQKYTFVEFAVGDYLDYRAAERGLIRKEATKAVRLVYFNTKVSLGTIFTTLNGEDSLNFTITKYLGTSYQTPEGTVVTGYYFYEATCEVTGIIGNGYIGSIQPAGSIKGLTTAQMTDILVPGTEIETDESLRKRYIESLNEKGFAGNIAAYREEILKMDGVGAIQVWPFWKGGGTVRCCILDAEFNAATASLVNTVQEAISPINPDDNKPTQNGVGFAPIGASVTINAPEILTVNIECQIQCKAGYFLDNIKEDIKKNIEEYFLIQRKQWDVREPGIDIYYYCEILYTQVLAAIIGTDGVLNCKELLINGKTQDISVMQSRELSQLPILGDADFKEWIYE